MSQIMSGNATSAQIGALLVALKMKGESPDEIAGFAREMRAGCVPVVSNSPKLIDTCGTGGDTIKTFNLSTAAAIVASAGGAAVAKHGNRAVSSRCGSADVLEALGVNLSLSPEGAGKLLDEIGIAFLFAQGYHPAARHAALPRREIGLRTIFNLIGPLSNPAGARRQLLGVSAPDLVLKMAGVLRMLRFERAVVAHGVLGLDEVSPVGPTRLAIIEGESLEEKTVHPEDFGVEPLDLARIAGEETAAGNAAKLMRAIQDADSPEAQAVIPSAGVALWLADIAPDMFEGARLAKEAIRSGAAARKLDLLIERSNE